MDLAQVALCVASRLCAHTITFSRASRVLVIEDMRPICAALFALPILAACKAVGDSLIVNFSQ